MKKIILYLLLLSTGAVYGQTNFKQVFKKYNVTGSTTIYNRGKMKWIYTDSLDARRETLPAATFDLINSCIALETGAIKTENEVLRWDGKNRSFFGQNNKSWNKDTDLKTAYKNGNVWFYPALAQKVGRKDYMEFLKACNYGNMDLSEKGADFWNVGRFAIAPYSQVNFLRYFISDQLSFSPRTFRIVQELMDVEKNNGYTLSDKTGWTKANGKDINWQIGYVKVKNDTYYFATRLITPSVKNGNPDLAKTAKKITLEILKQIKAID